MTTDRNDQIVAAYAAGDDVTVIAARFGVRPGDVTAIVDGETSHRPTMPPAARRDPRLTVVGGILLGVGLVGPCLGSALWLAVYYLSEAAYPVSSWAGGNVAVGLIGLLAGAVIAAAGAIVLSVSRRPHP